MGQGFDKIAALNNCEENCECGFFATSEILKGWEINWNLFCKY